MCLAMIPRWSRYHASTSEIDKHITGKSQTYVSRVLTPNDILAGSSEFWSCLEKEVGRLIQEKRRNQIFAVVPVDVSKAEVLHKSA